MDAKTKCMVFVEVYLAAWTVVLLVPLLLLWPKTDGGRPDDASARAAQIGDPNEAGETSDSLETAEDPISGWTFVAMAMIMGALGACLHGMTSLAFHRGKKKFTAEWTLWYVYRPFVGSVLALVFYLVIRAGMMPEIDDNDPDIFFLLLGISGLIGLFSKQALIKLRLIVDAVLASDKDEKPSGKSTTQPESDLSE